MDKKDIEKLSAADLDVLGKAGAVHEGPPPYLEYKRQALVEKPPMQCSCLPPDGTCKRQPHCRHTFPDSTEVPPRITYR